MRARGNYKTVCLSGDETRGQGNVQNGNRRLHGSTSAIYRSGDRIPHSAASGKRIGGGQASRFFKFTLRPTLEPIASGACSRPPWCPNGGPNHFHYIIIRDDRPAAIIPVNKMFPFFFRYNFNTVFFDRWLGPALTGTSPGPHDNKLKKHSKCISEK